ncbi:hypothetical protein ADICYQ_1105 [Cyclobacterium qasimii M12-11B]|uniref:Uncharacterized protein n=1 Tax=Cyclobacterium qasimii M12-11B TaxID=641524 RepID=S7WT19_9BACT|nr:hypothetical protein ADICYQ_1105 [Cyclobacterium qasimii M12-11B]
MGVYFLAQCQAVIDCLQLIQNDLPYHKWLIRMNAQILLF